MGDEHVPSGLGAGPLSTAAEGRRARRGIREEAPPADLADHGAVSEWRRRVHAAWGEEDPPDAPHRRDRRCGVAVRVAGPDAGPLVVYLHGGGYVLGSAMVAAPITARWARAGLRIVSVDYRLAPEHPLPAALDDVLAVVGALTRPYALAGDSAGGGLALAAALALAEVGRPGPRALALLSPLVRVRPGTPFADAYLGPAAPHDPRASPILGELRGLPPTLVQVSSSEAGFADVVAFARLARTEGVAVTLDVWLDLPHTWHYHRDLPEADRALAEASAFVHTHLRS